MQRDAVRLLHDTFTRLVREADVLDHLRRDNKLSEGLRREVLARFGEFPEPVSPDFFAQRRSARKQDFNCF